MCAKHLVLTLVPRDYDIHGPAGPTAFWKAADAENPRDTLLQGFGGILVRSTGAVGLVGETVSSEDGLDFMDEDDDEDDDWDDGLEPIADELPGLLQDAEMELIDLTPHTEQS